MADKLTTVNYWESYYNTASTDAGVIIRICSEFDTYWEKWMSLVEHPTSLIEIGAYPGRYIAYLAKRYNIPVTGLDYNSDRKKVEESMKIMGVTDYEYIQQDFFNYTPDKKYDLVFSNGFIEHFDDFNRVMDLHVPYMSDKGSLLLMIPNKNYLRKLYGKIYDKENLDVHNLNCMYLSVFKKFADRNNLDVKFLDYQGGFAYAYHKPLKNKFKLYSAELIIRLSKKLNPVLSRNPSKYYSSNIIGIFTKKK